MSRASWCSVGVVMVLGFSCSQGDDATDDTVVSATGSDPGATASTPTSSMTGTQPAPTMSGQPPAGSSGMPSATATIPPAGTEPDEDPPMMSSMPSMTVTMQPTSEPTETMMVPSMTATMPSMDPMNEGGAGGDEPVEMGGAPGGGAGGSGGSGGSSMMMEPEPEPEGMLEFDPCPAAEACKILPLGDSITDGIGSDGGYRVSLFARALDAGKTITFLGGSMNGPAMVGGQPFPQRHEGHSGWTVQQIDGITPSPALDDDPHIILLHIGTNDMYQMPQGAEDRLGELIDQIIEAQPEALLVVSTIIPFPGAADPVDTFNAEVPGVVEARAAEGAHILLVDQFTGFPTSELGDGVHPNAAGYERMAGVWFEAIEPYLH